MFSKELRKTILENRLARLTENGKDNWPIRKKTIRQLRGM